MPFTVYVIRLKPEVLRVGRFARKNPDYVAGKACLYVGQTWHSPEHRFQQHRAGEKSCDLVEQYHWGIHRKLTRRNPPYERREEAEAREVEYAEELRREGYAVWYG